MCHGIVGVNVLEHRGDILEALVGQDADLFGLLLRGADRRVRFLVERGVAFVVPFAERDQMRLQSRDRVAQRPFLGFVLGAIAGGIVGGRMALGAVGEELDQRRALVDPRPFARPLDRGIDGERIIAVDAKAGDAIADRAAGEGRLLGAGDSAERLKSPTGC